MLSDSIALFILEHKSFHEPECFWTFTKLSFSYSPFTGQKLFQCHTKIFRVERVIAFILHLAFLEPYLRISLGQYPTKVALDKYFPNVYFIDFSLENFLNQLLLYNVTFSQVMFPIFTQYCTRGTGFSFEIFFVLTLCCTGLGAYWKYSQWKTNYIQYRPRAVLIYGDIFCCHFPNINILGKCWQNAYHFQSRYFEDSTAIFKEIVNIRLFFFLIWQIVLNASTKRLFFWIFKRHVCFFIWQKIDLGFYNAI